MSVHVRETERVLKAHGNEVVSLLHVPLIGQDYLQYDQPQNIKVSESWETIPAIFNSTPVARATAALIC